MTYLHLKNHSVAACEVSGTVIRFKRRISLKKRNQLVSALLTGVLLGGTATAAVSSAPMDTAAEESSHEVNTVGASESDSVEEEEDNTDLASESSETELAGPELTQSEGSADTGGEESGSEESSGEEGGSGGQTEGDSSSGESGADSTSEGGGDSSASDSSGESGGSGDTAESGGSSESSGTESSGSDSSSGDGETQAEGQENKQGEEDAAASGKEADQAAENEKPAEEAETTPTPEAEEEKDEKESADASAAAQRAVEKKTAEIERQNRDIERMRAASQLAAKKAADEEREIEASRSSGFLSSNRAYYSGTYFVTNAQKRLALNVGFTKIEKVPAMSAGESSVNILEAKSDTARTIGVLGAKDVCYILSEENDGSGWAYVESGEVRGFVKMSSLKSGAQVSEYVDSLGETGITTAEQLVDPLENTAYRYSLNTTKDVTSIIQALGTATVDRQAMIAFAEQFVGNPYVWGGESLTKGCDCSGFTQQVYAQFGISLPRTSYEQAEVGVKIPKEEALPGDLLFYARDGVVYHVLMYVGNGQAVNASSSATGIIVQNVDYNKVCWGCRYISDTGAENVAVPGSNNSTQASSLQAIGQMAYDGDAAAQEAIIEALAQASLKEWKTYGFCRSVIIAQAINESGWLSFGSSAAGIQSTDNNILGMNEDLNNSTWTSPWDGSAATRLVPQYVGGGNAYNFESMRLYEDMESCMVDYAAFKVGLHPDLIAETDVDHVIAVGLKGYATNPNYQSEIRALIDKFDLTRFDTEETSAVRPENTVTEEKESTEDELNKMIDTILAEDETAENSADEPSTEESLDELIPTEETLSEELPAENTPDDADDGIIDAVADDDAEDTAEDTEQPAVDTDAGEAKQTSEDSAASVEKEPSEEVTRSEEEESSEDTVISEEEESSEDAVISEEEKSSGDTVISEEKESSESAAISEAEEPSGNAYLVIDGTEASCGEAVETAEEETTTEDALNSAASGSSKDTKDIASTEEKPLDPKKDTADSTLEPYTAAILGSNGVRLDTTEYTEAQLELIWAVVAQEDDTSYDGALAVISSVMNRADVNYGGFGTTAFDQLTAESQYAFSPDVEDPLYYERRLKGTVPDFVKQAVSDCLTGGLRNHSYISFRADDYVEGSVQIGANYYFYETAANAAEAIENMTDVIGEIAEEIPAGDAVEEEAREVSSGDTAEEAAPQEIFVEIPDAYYIEDDTPQPEEENVVLDDTPYFNDPDDDYFSGTDENGYFVIEAVPDVNLE